MSFFCERILSNVIELGEYNNLGRDNLIPEVTIQIRVVEVSHVKVYERIR